MQKYTLSKLLQIYSIRQKKQNHKSYQNKMGNQVIKKLAKFIKIKNML